MEERARARREVKAVADQAVVRRLADPGEVLELVGWEQALDPRERPSSTAIGSRTTSETPTRTTKQPASKTSRPKRRDTEPAASRDGEAALAFTAGFTQRRLSHRASLSGPAPAQPTSATAATVRIASLVARSSQPASSRVHRRTPLVLAGWHHDFAQEVVPGLARSAGSARQPWPPSRDSARLTGGARPAGPIPSDDHPLGLVGEDLRAGGRRAAPGALRGMPGRGRSVATSRSASNPRPPTTARAAASLLTTAGPVPHMRAAAYACS